MNRHALIPAFSLASAISALAAVPSDCWSFRKHGHIPEAQACFEGLTHSSDASYRAEGFWGLEQWEHANEQFRLAAQPTTSTPAALPPAATAVQRSRLGPEARSRVHIRSMAPCLIGSSMNRHESAEITTTTATWTAARARSGLELAGVVSTITG